MAKAEHILKCQQAAAEIRRDIIEMAYAAGNLGAHLGGSLSMAEILAALYIGTAKFDRNNLEWEERDRIILSKGHAALAFYPALAQAEILEKDELHTFKKNGSRLSGHPSLNGLPGIEYASGSLGQGLSLGVGVCLALRKKNNLSSRVFVLMGDGECDEGSVWEAAASASHFQLNQLVAIIDRNHIQYDGETSRVMSMEPMPEKWKSFGWDAQEVDGHNTGALLDAYGIKGSKPLAIIADTVKGKGISFMEGNCRFHNSRLSEAQYQQAVAELGDGL
ncbi:MAG: transketolase [Lachnospiraceae bacterium]|nr:transketolase [Lachnospiraceae bacterium]